LLDELKSQNLECFVASAFDVTNTTALPQNLQQLTVALQGLDLLVLSSGTGKINPSLDPGIEKYTNEVNVAGFTAVADWAISYFEKQGHGHFAAITSVAAIRGSRHAPAYNASKAYQVNYLEGLQQRLFQQKKPIYITDVRPGFVDTAMAAGNVFWMAPLDKAGKQILRALKNKRKVVYITKRWRIIGFLLRLIPGFLYKRM
jgi:short-subunit dehydrogenase